MARQENTTANDHVTMADVEWKDEKHHLAGANTPDEDEVVMMWRDTLSDVIATDWGQCRSDLLSPNGKKYKIVEITEPDQTEHREILETVEDFENAPDGTIVSVPGSGFPWTKRDGVWHSENLEYTAEDMTQMNNVHILRWNYGGEE